MLWGKIVSTGLNIFLRKRKSAQTKREKAKEEEKDRKTNKEGDRLKNPIKTIEIETIEKGQRKIKRTTMKIRNSISFIIIFVSLLSCSEPPFYEGSYSFKNKEWKHGQKAKFVVSIDDLDQAYDFTLTLRTTTDYKYNNLWVFMNTKAPNGETGREPYEIKITNPDGSWIGTKTGSVVETPLSFKQRKLPVEGKYNFSIEQGITNTTIGEVLDLVLTVQPSTGPTEN